MTPEQKATLLELAERVERAQGADRALDIAILTQVLGYRDIYGDGQLFDRGNDGYWSLNGDEKNPALPSPTASIDAAMTLVPEGCILRQYTASRFVPHTCEVSRDAQFGGWIGHSDPSFALALCAASLRALSNQEGDKS